MNISLNWLTDYVDVSISAQDLGRLFTVIGLNCEDIKQTDSDIVFDLEMTSNRPDWLGHLGVARELAAALDIGFRKPGIELPAPVGKVEDLTRVDVQDSDLCPRYTARVIRNVKIGPSPKWLVDYLEAIGMRSINNVVDITNFVLMEYAQPLHSFDYDKLAEGRIVVRRAKKGETLVSIDETTCELTEDMLVIADAEKPVAIAGVMGGLATEVTESTTNILLESAQFDPLVTRKTSRKLGILSESNYRFERGVDPVAIDEASQRACALICELAGGELAEGMIDVWAKPYESPMITLRPKRAEALIGIEISAETQIQRLSGLGLNPRLSPKLNHGLVICTIPPWRPDLRREVDLIEEVARLVGFDKIPAKGAISHPVIPLSQNERIRRSICTTLNAAGYDEAITFSFIDDAEAKLFGYDEAIRVDSEVRKTNNTLRPTLLTSLTHACKTNQDYGNESVRLFELAAVFPYVGPGELPGEFIELAMVTTDDLRSLRGAMEAVIDRIAPTAHLDIRPAAVTGFTPEISAEILLDGQVVGAMGRVSVNVQKYYGLENAIAAARLRYDALTQRANLVRTAHSLPKFPSSSRDLSLILDDAVAWGDLSAVIAAVDQPLRERYEYVTTYRGKPIPAGKKSVTITLEYRSTESTLTSEQVDQQIEQILQAAKERFSADLRV